MPPRRAAATAADRARLYREAEELIERYRARLSPDDLTADDELVRQRAAIMAQIQAVGAAGGDERGSDAAESITAVERMIELNRELVAVLQVERDRRAAPTSRTSARAAARSGRIRGRGRCRRPSATGSGDRRRRRRLGPRRRVARGG